MNRNKPHAGEASGSTTSATRSTRRTAAVRPQARAPPARAQSKSPARAKSPARRKSPSRLKSESSPAPIVRASTPKSPGASGPKARSPIRKSPTRMVKVQASSVDTYFGSAAHQASISTRGRPPKKSYVEMEDDSDVEEVTVDKKPQAAVRGRARRLEIQVEKLDVRSSEPLGASSSENILKRITRGAGALSSSTSSTRTEHQERIVQLKHFDSVDTVSKKLGLGEFSSDDDDVRILAATEKVIRPSRERIGDFQKLSEFGGLFGAIFFVLAFPLGLIGLYIVCNEHQCSFVSPPKNWRKFVPAISTMSTYFDSISFLGVVCYFTLLALLSVLPFGGRKVAGLPAKDGKFVYTMNGFFSCALLTALAAALEVRGISVSGYIVEHLFHLLIASTVVGFLLSLYAYVRSFYVPLSHLNTHVIDSHPIYGFFMGREVNPRIFGILDLKMFVLRLGLIGTVLLDFAILYKSLDIKLPQVPELVTLKQINLHPTLIALVAMHAVYCLDGLLYEAAWVTSFEVQYEGFGFMGGVGYMIYPFMIAVCTKYVYDYHVNLAMWKIVLTALVFLLGYLLFRGSNSQKDAFRKNPYNPALSHLETIPTMKGKKLICSGFWGIVRHPNYLGDILMNLSFAPFVLTVPPIITILSIVVLLVHRSVRDNARCKQKYGTAWDRYCNKVKYVLVPKVY